MAKVVITIKIMPDDPGANLDKIETEAKKLMLQFGAGDDIRVERKPFAFGLIAIEMIFVMDESLGSTESLETDIGNVEGVGSVNVIDVRRAIG